MGKLQFAPALALGWQIFTKDPLNLILGAIIAGVLSLTVFLFPVMIAGYVFLARRVAKSEKAELGDIFHGFNDFGRYLLGVIICLLAMLPAILLCCELTLQPNKNMQCSQYHRLLPSERLR